MSQGKCGTKYNYFDVQSGQSRFQYQGLAGAFFRKSGYLYLAFIPGVWSCEMDTYYPPVYLFCLKFVYLLPTSNMSPFQINKTPGKINSFKINNINCSQVFPRFGMSLA